MAVIRRGTSSKVRAWATYTGMPSAATRSMSSRRVPSSQASTRSGCSAATDSMETVPALETRGRFFASGG